MTAARARPRSYLRRPAASGFTALTTRSSSPFTAAGSIQHATPTRSWSGIWQITYAPAPRWQKVESGALRHALEEDEGP